MTIQTKVVGAQPKSKSFGDQTGIITVLAAELAALILENQQIEQAALDIKDHKEHPGAGLAGIKLESRAGAIFERRSVLEQLILRSQSSGQSEALLQAILVRNDIGYFDGSDPVDGAPEKDLHAQMPQWSSGMQSVINALKSTGAHLLPTLAIYYDSQRDTCHTPFEGLAESLENAERVISTEYTN